MIKNCSPFTIVEEKNHRYIWHRGQLIYKQQWLDKHGNKTQPSLLFRKNGWPNYWVN